MTKQRKKKQSLKQDALHLSDQSKTVAERAYEIWLEEGCPHDKALDHWVRAEHECGLCQTATPEESV